MANFLSYSNYVRDDCGLLSYVLLKILFCLNFSPELRISKRVLWCLVEGGLKKLLYPVPLEFISKVPENPFDCCSGSLFFENVGVETLIALSVIEFFTKCFPGPFGGRLILFSGFGSALRLIKGVLMFSLVCIY